MLGLWSIVWTQNAMFIGWVPLKTLVSVVCKHVHLKNRLRIIHKSFTSDSNSNGQLDFYWYSVSFEVNITSDTSAGFLGVYIIHTLDQQKACTHYNSVPTGYDEALVFKFGGNSTTNVNCTLEGNKSVCSSFVDKISITQRYYVCMLFSSRDIEEHHNINGTICQWSYLWSEWYRVQWEDRVSTEWNWLLCYLRQELVKPTCIFVQTTTLGSDNQAKEIRNVFPMFSHKKWDAVIYTGVLGTLFLFSLVVNLLCICGRTIYWKRHPNQCCMELTLAGHVCSC